MSDRLERQLQESRALKDAALSAVKLTMAQVKQDYSTTGIGTRLTRRMTEGTHDILEQASQKTTGKQGVILVGLGAIGLWFTRRPLLALIERHWLTGTDEAGQDCANSDKDAQDDTLPRVGGVNHE